MTTDDQQDETPNQEAIKSELLDDEELEEPLIGTFEDSTVPDRDLRRLQDVLKSARHEEEIALTLGTGEVQVIRSGTVVGKKGSRSNRVPHIDWDFTLEIAISVEDGPTRLYRTGIGDENLEPWTIFSYEYNEDLGMMDEESEIGHGWVIDAKRNP